MFVYPGKAGETNRPVTYLGFPAARGKPTLHSEENMKLQQDQVWQQGDTYLRIVHLERLKVRYKQMKDVASKAGTHHDVSKKEFCRLIKGATLLTPAVTTGS